MIDASTINLIPVVLFVMHVVIGTPGWPDSENKITNPYIVLTGYMADEEK